MREIEFRGKIPDGQWVFGDLIKDPCEIDGEKYIEYMIRHYDEFTIDGNEIFEFVMDKTVGQYTGLKDKNGKKIFDGDIVRSVHYKSNEKTYYIKHVCEWSEKYSGWFMRSSKHIGNIYFKHGDIQAFVYFNSAVDPEIIGNKYDNHELLR